MTSEFIKDTVLRMAWTFAEALLGAITIGQTITEIQWGHALSISAVAAIACLLKQIAKYGKEHTSPEYDDTIEYLEDGDVND